jgi:hypothetical protein
MSDTIEVDAARVDDRNQVAAMLRERGFDVQTVDEGGRVGIDIPCGGDAGRRCEEIVSELEAWIAESGIPLVPEQLDDRVFLRPPGS